MPEPFGDLILPVDDKAWDDGDPARALNSPTDSPITQAQAPFSRLCQAAMQISKVMTHVREVIHGNTHHNPIPSNTLFVVSLSDTLAAFALTIQQEISSFSSSQPSLPTPPSSSSSNTTSIEPYPLSSLLPPLTLSLSALVLLFDVYCTPENQHAGPAPSPLDSDVPPFQSQSHREMQLRSMNGLKEVAFKGRDIALEILDLLVLPSEQKRLSPLCLDALYGSLATFHWLWKESGDDEVRKVLEDVRRCLGRVNMRWRLAGGYLDLVGYHDVNEVMALRAR